MEHQPGSYDVDELNEAQRRAVTVGDGAVCVIAGPGSGKTKVISYRTAWLLREQDVSPTNIVLMTFTNKSASEMKARVANLVGSDSVGRLMMGTFHSISFRLLRQHGQRVGLPKQFSIADASSQLSIVKKIAKDRSLQDKPKSVLAAISKYKSQNKSPEDVRSELKKKTSTEYTIPDIAGIYQQYQDALSKSNNLDFDDLLVYCHRLLSKYPAVASRFEHVLVDEFQDTSQLQFDICKMLAHRGNLFAVGDEDQSIYTWRQADASCFIKLKKIYPRIESVVLEQNYRSSQAILNLSRAVIEEEKVAMFPLCESF